MAIIEFELGQNIFIMWYIYHIYKVYMPKKDYRSISVPIRIYKPLEEIVNDNESLYTSISDLAKEALREKIIKIRSQTTFSGREDE